MPQEKMVIVQNADLTKRCRAIHKPALYTLLPAENRVMSDIPGLSGARVQVLATPQLGARFTEYEMVIQAGGKTNGVRLESFEHFFYIKEGEVTFILDGKKNKLEKGGFCWLPPDFPYEFVNPQAQTANVIWIRRRFNKVADLDVPNLIVSHESDVVAYPTDTYMEKHLTPYENIQFDMGINLQIFDPGVYFSFVESHIMEHGLYMVYGRGIYFLNGDYIEVQSDDFIYMAPYCSQFFFSTGWDRSAYLLYKDVNRDYLPDKQE